MRSIWLAALVGCAPATVDRVQPNAVSKATFDGEWYWLDTVVDAPYGTAQTFVGAQGSLERLTWRVEEDMLLGVRSYENVDGAGADGDAVVVAWRIDKHFDIRRSYDPRTGEETNVIEENTERPWYEREFMRVDWSQNLAQLNGVQLAGVNVPVTSLLTADPSDAWKPELDDSDGDGVIDHLRLTSRVIAQPDTEVIDGYGAVPSCWFYGRRTVDCAASEVVISSTFRRVDPDDLYVGVAWAGTWQQTFGFFDQERLHWDERYGVTEPERVRWAARHDLWEDEVRRDDAGRPLCRANRQEAPCETFSVRDDPKPSLIPYRERTVRPVVYHVSEGFDPDLRGALARLEREWNVPFRDTVNQLRFWECKDEGGRRCDDEVDPELRAFVLCPNNPSVAGDPAVCDTDHTGPDGRPDGVPDPVRPGDLRYNLLVLVDEPQTSSPLGYGPSAADPSGSSLSLSDGKLELGAGRILAGTANVYDFGLTRIAAQTTDLIRLVEGDLAEEEFLAGEDIEAWVEELRQQGTTEGMTGSFGAPARGLRASGDTPRRALAGMDGAWSAPVWERLRDLGLPRRPEELDGWRASVDAELARASLLRPTVPGASAWQAMVDSPFDEPLWAPETLAAAGLDPALASDPAALAARSPLQAVDPAASDAVEAGLRQAGAHALDLDDGAYTNPALLGLARDWRAQGLSYEEIYARAREEMFVAVTLHELGHTLGLRHNFAASTDAWNFPTSYWALRDDGQMGPRHVDPETEAEIDGRIRERQYSSVMDYGADTNGDWHGLGRYDHAAIKFGYGQLVEVMTSLRGTPALDGISNADAVGYVSYFYQSPVYPAPILGGDDGMLELHYTDYPRVADLEARVDVPLRRLAPRLEGDPDAPGFDRFLAVERGEEGVVAVGAPAAPYRFCSDELAGQGMCARWDTGADPYEIVQAYQQQYWDRYILDNFARNRYGFGFGDYAGAQHRRIFRPLHGWARTYALFYTFLGASFDPAAADWFAADRGMGGWTLASADTFRFLTQVVARPEPGSLGWDDRPDGVRLLSSAAAEPFLDLPLGAGAWYDSDWEDGAGYWWFERYRRIGTVWDRMIALQVLTSLDPYAFVGFDTASDPRAYALGFASLWRDPLTRFLGSLVADDVAALAPVWQDGGLRYPDPTTPDAAWPPEGAEGLVEPGAWWLVRYSAGLYGAALLREGYDHSWLDRGRIYAEGSDEAVAPPDGVATVSFTDPFTGLVWTAWSYPDAGGLELGPGARLLARANRLAAWCAGDDLAPYTDPSDPDALDWQQQITCGELRSVAADIELQSRLVAWFRQSAW